MKKMLSVVAAVFCVAAAFAYEPALGGESLFELAGAHSMVYGTSVTGGGIKYITPSSVVVNPALTAKEQRVALNTGYTALLTGGENQGFGSLFQAGITMPFKWAIFSGNVYGNFPNSSILGVSENLTFKAALSKEITEHLNVGVGVNTGFAWGKNADWGISANLGFVYDIPELAFMKDFRFGASISNLGKNYATSYDRNFINSYPTFATIRGGVSALMIKTDMIKLGVNLDLTTPCFCNMILDTGVQFMIKDMLTISISEKINMREAFRGTASFIPTIGVFFSFRFNVKDNDYMAENDWSESEMTVGAAYRQVYPNVNAITSDVNILLGLKDEAPPVIQVWFDEDDE